MDGMEAREGDGDQEPNEPELQRAFAAEPVADRARGEEQSGEDEKVLGPLRWTQRQENLEGKRMPRHCIVRSTGGRHRG